MTDFRMVTVTPKIAQEWLLKNEGNRRLSANYVNTLADAIMRGEWTINGETIKFASTGTLIDGQHRLSAVIKSGLPIDVYVVTGLDMGSRDTVDTCRARSNADVLALHGEKNASKIAAAIRFVYMFENGIPLGHGARLTRVQCLNEVRRHPGLHDSLRPAEAVRASEVNLACAPGAAAHYIFSSIDAQSASEFFSGLASGAGLSEGDPILALRRAIILTRGKIQSRSNAMRGEQALAMLAKAWSAKLAGKSMKLLRLGETDVSPTIPGAKEALRRAAKSSGFGGGLQ